MKKSFKSVWYSTALSSILLFSTVDAYSSYQNPPQQFRSQTQNLKELLFRASRTGNTGLVNQILGLMSPQDRDQLLFEAVQQGDHLLIEILIAQRANVNTRDQNGETPLHLAARGGKGDAVERLLVQGGKRPPPWTIDVNAVNVGGATPLHWAAMNGDVNTIQVLLNYRAQINPQARSGKTPLDYAVEKGNIKAADFLRSKGARSVVHPEYNLSESPAAVESPSVPSEVPSAAVAAPQITTQDIMPYVNVYVSAQPSFKKYGDSILKELEAAMKALLDDPKIQALNLSIATYMVMMNQVGANLVQNANVAPDIVSLTNTLSKLRGNPLASLSPDDKSALANTIRTALINSGAQDAGLSSAAHPPASGGAPVVTPPITLTKEQLVKNLFDAAVRGDNEALKSMIESGADVNYASPGLGETPLHYAAKRGNVNAIKALLAAQAEIDVKTKSSSVLSSVQGETPLMLAVQAGKLDAVKELLNAGANVQETDAEGETPLHYAARRGDVDMVNALIAKNANVNAQTKQIWGGGGARGGGQTPLHWAVLNGHTQVVQALLNNGADPTIENNSKQTPLDYAQKGKKTDIIQILTNK